MTNLSAPIHRLKREARLLARRDRIPLHEALDRVAAREGRRSWSHLVQGLPAPVRASGAGGLPAGELFRRFDPGDLVLLGARPGQGKTLMGLRLLMEALETGATACSSRSNTPFATWWIGCAALDSTR